MLRVALVLLGLVVGAAAPAAAQLAEALRSPAGTMVCVPITPTAADSARYAFRFAELGDNGQVERQVVATFDSLGRSRLIRISHDRNHADSSTTLFQIIARLQDEIGGLSASVTLTKTELADSTLQSRKAPLIAPLDVATLTRVREFSDQLWTRRCDAIPNGAALARQP